MSKMFSERLLPDENEAELKSGAIIRLRFERDPLIKPLFKAILQPKNADVVNYTQDLALEGDFTVATVQDGGTLEGDVRLSGEVRKDDTIAQKIDYEVFPAEELAIAENKAADVVVEEGPKILDKETLAADPPLAKVPAVNGKPSFKPSKGGKVPLGVVKFTLADKNIGNASSKSEIRWVLYQGHGADQPIMLLPVKGAEVEIDFATLPKGKYRVEPYGAMSEWHAKNKVDRFGQPSTKSFKSYPSVDVESSDNALDSITTDALNEKKQLNWGVDVTFKGGLLFDVAGDKSKIVWRLLDAQGVEVPDLKPVLNAAGDASTWNFPYPGEGISQSYKLEARFGESVKMVDFVVHHKNTVKQMVLKSKAQSYLHNADATLEFSVTDFTLKQANATDIQNIKWVRLYFAGLSYEDYAADKIKVTMAGGIVSSATLFARDKEHVAKIDQLSGEKGKRVINLPAGTKSDPNAPYDKGLYIVEAYTGAADGKSSTAFPDMTYYEVARNEVTGINGRKFVRVAPEGFEFQVTSWKFGDAHGEGANVHWAISSGGKEYYDEKLKGVKVKLHFPVEGEYEIKAWVADRSKAISFNVTVQRAKILNAFIADSSGKRIKRCGIDDKVYLYMKTSGLQGEELRVGLYDYDYVSDDDLLMDTNTKVDESGVIFQEIQLTKSMLDYAEGNDEAEAYPVILMPKGGFSITLDNLFVDRDAHKAYYLTDESLTIETTSEPIDYNFLDADGKVLQRVVLYGEKVKLRVRFANMHGQKMHLMMIEGENLSKWMPVQESIQIVEVNGEGFAELEFTVPKEWEVSHSAQFPHIPRSFGPGILYEGEQVPIEVPVDTLGKRLLVGKQQLEGGLAELISFEKVEYADIQHEQKAALDSNIIAIFPLESRPLNTREGKWGSNFDFLAPDKSNQSNFGRNRDGGARKHAAIDMYTEPYANVRAIASGTVLDVSSFYYQTDEIVVVHDLQVIGGYNLIARYGELDPKSNMVKTGDRVEMGQIIGKTGILIDATGKEIKAVAGEVVPMLHLELYSGELGTNLAKNPLTTEEKGFQRRSDLFDPRTFIQEIYTNTFRKEVIKDKPITEDDYIEQANILGVEVAAMKAIAENETKTKSFVAPNHATILFERHVFYSELKKRGYDVETLQTQQPDLVNKYPSPSGTYGTSLEQLGRLERAKLIDKEAAISSCSWGKFQVMGFNFWMAGYTSPMEMEEAVNAAEYHHLVLFVGYLTRVAGLTKAMNDHNWEEVARLYNGNGWKEKNPNYAVDLEKNYQKHAK